MLNRLLIRLGILAKPEENDYYAWADLYLDGLVERCCVKDPQTFTAASPLYVIAPNDPHNPEASVVGTWATRVEAEAFLAAHRGGWFRRPEVVPLWVRR